MTTTEKEFSADLLNLWERDYTVARGARCVRRLIGKLCLLGGRDCTCEPPGADHTSLWKRKADGKLVMVTQPYGAIDEEYLMELFDFCNAHGLKFSVSAGSWHYPGWTTLIAFEAANITTQAHSAPTLK